MIYESECRDTENNVNHLSPCYCSKHTKGNRDSTVDINQDACLKKLKV